MYSNIINEMLELAGCDIINETFDVKSSNDKYRYYMTWNGWLVSPYQRIKIYIFPEDRACVFSGKAKLNEYVYEQFNDYSDYELNEGITEFGLPYFKGSHEEIVECLFDLLVKHTINVYKYYTEEDTFNLYPFYKNKTSKNGEVKRQIKYIRSGV